mmetsp:Transcript_38605/g.96999  ORF Transcript_38605/g.96999 Transcript_38605/m.96999 type:complete len:275 (-) Transcript_38605:27-851(-)
MCGTCAFGCACCRGTTRCGSRSRRSRWPLHRAARLASRVSPPQARRWCTWRPAGTSWACGTWSTAAATRCFGWLASGSPSPPAPRYRWPSATCTQPPSPTRQRWRPGYQAACALRSSQCRHRALPGAARCSPAAAAPCSPAAATGTCATGTPSSRSSRISSLGRRPPRPPLPTRRRLRTWCRAATSAGPLTMWMRWWRCPCAALRRTASPPRRKTTRWRTARSTRTSSRGTPATKTASCTWRTQRSTTGCCFRAVETAPSRHGSRRRWCICFGL